MMKVIDHAGNSLVKGRLLRWQPRELPDLYVKVSDVVPPTTEMPGKVELIVTFGIKPVTKKETDSGGAVSFRDFITVFDPEDELKAEAALAKATEALPKAMSAR